jgi:Mg2+ and Co2+ transporter CorA
MIRDIDSGFTGADMPRQTHYISPVREEKAVCISRNLVVLADAFSQLTSLEVLSIPQAQREAVRDGLDEVWQVMELIRHLEDETESLSQKELAALNPWSVR